MQDAVRRKLAAKIKQLTKSKGADAGNRKEFQMRGAMVNFTKVFANKRGGKFKTAIVLGAIGLALSGCVVYPSNGYGYGGGYAAPAYYAPPVVVGVGGGWGWGGGWGHGWGGGGGHWH